MKNTELKATELPVDTVLVLGGEEYVLCAGDQDCTVFVWRHPHDIEESLTTLLRTKSVQALLDMGVGVRLPEVVNEREGDVL